MGGDHHAKQNKSDFAADFERGSGQQLQQLWSFLYQTVEQLNVCLNSIDEDNLASDVREKLNTVFDLTDELQDARAAASGKTGQLDKATQNALTDTQDTLQSNMDSVEQELSDEISVNAAAIDALEERADALEAKNFDERYSLIGHTHSEFINYTTAEQSTGFTWPDGKTVYRVSFTWSGSANDTSVTVGTIDAGYTGIVDIGAMVRLSGGIWRPAGYFHHSSASHNGTVTIKTDTGSYSGSYTYYTSGMGEIACYVDASGNVIVHVDTGTIDTANVTVWYTK